LGNDAALQVITRTLGILAKVVATHKGSLIKTIGDEIMCSFPNINLAIQAAGTMHKAIEQLQPGGKDSIHVRIGFHYGEVICKENDIFGDAVNIASRVTAVTRSRQIMTTKAVVDLLPAGLLDRVRPVMRAAFRGKQDSFAVFQILWEAEDSDSARVGQSSWRVAESNQNKTSSGDQTSQPTAVRFTSTLILDKPFDSLPGAMLERLTH
jgi:class 3 adenylate cyclase